MTQFVYNTNSIVNQTLLAEQPDLNRSFLASTRELEFKRILKEKVSNKLKKLNHSRQEMEIKTVLYDFATTI